MTKEVLIKLIAKYKKRNASVESLAILEQGLEKWDDTPEELRWALTHTNKSCWLLEK